MDNCARSDEILALGRKVVEELGLEPSVDTLGRWMAHYIADLITKAKGATGEEKGFLEKKCFESILTLWKHRAELPNGKRPFEELEPVIRAIESLDPDDDTPRYFRSGRPPKGEGEEKSELEAWLDMASEIDYSARVLIGYCLAQAAEAAVDKSKEWVKLAKAAGAEDEVAKIVVNFLSSEADVGREPDPSDEARSQLQNRIVRLEGFIKLVDPVLHDLKRRLEACPLPRGKGINERS
jgi:hypothetical protein